MGDGFGIKRFLPRHLFGRSLIIIVAPILLLQGIMAYVFFERDLDTTTRRLARDGETLSRDELSTAPENGENSAGRQVDVQVTRLRRKIEDDPRFPRYLQTVRGRGYLLQPD